MPKGAQAVLLTTNYCLWIAASAAAELAPIANSTSGIQSRAVAARPRFSALWSFF
jgi:hypothetical protein